MRFASADLAISRPSVRSWEARSFWKDIFENDAPVEIEIGSGDGSFLAAIAALNPSTNFLGIERSPSKARRLAARVQRLGTERVRSLHADASCVVQTLIPASSVSAYHLYFPDPWPKRRHAKRRIVTDEFLSALARTLIPWGQFFVATDVYGYLRLIVTQVVSNPTFEQRGTVAQHPGLATAFARKYRAAGRTVYAATFVRRPGSEAIQLPPAAALKIRSS